MDLSNIGFKPKKDNDIYKAVDVLMDNGYTVSLLKTSTEFKVSIFNSYNSYSWYDEQEFLREYHNWLELEDY